ncbi:MAG: AMP-dependent synthetase/ligase [Thiobacillaceae bacterium]
MTYYAPLQPDRVATLNGLFAARVEATPDKAAYRQFDSKSGTWDSWTWKQVSQEVDRWRAALIKEGLSPGDRVAVMLKNCVEWIVFDQAALSLGLITVPLYLDDRPDNAVWIIDNAGARVLLVEGKFQHRKVAEIVSTSKRLERVVSLLPPERLAEWSPQFVIAKDWLNAAKGTPVPERRVSPDMLASIVYTSGTTGKPKGVMLTHDNMLWNAWYASQCLQFGPDEIFLSFLPLSHTLERTGGYYMPLLLGAEVVFSRSITLLAQDLQTIHPTVLVSVPRVYERIYGRIQDALAKKGAIAEQLFKSAVDVGWHKFEYEQGRASWHPKLLSWPLLKKLVADGVVERLGGRLKAAISGGAALCPQIARVFIGLGVPLYQGYGLTETSPVMTVNRPGANMPASVGKPLPGIEVKIDTNNELLSRSRCIMRGYWNDPEATAAAIDGAGWLHTGDQARMDEQGYLYITGRIKDIIVLSNGEKASPGDMESAITLDPLFEQAMIAGEGKPWLACVTSLNQEHWKAYCQEHNLNADRADTLSDRRINKLLLSRIGNRLKDFPGYAQVRRLHATLEPWTVENGLLTPTLKMKRKQIQEKYREAVEAMYENLSG